jgi:hypothetical protein
MNVISYITGTTRGKLTKTDASRIMIYKAPLDVQKKFSEIAIGLSGLSQLDIDYGKMRRLMQSSLFEALLALRGPPENAKVAAE